MIFLRLYGQPVFWGIISVGISIKFSDFLNVLKITSKDLRINLTWNLKFHTQMTETLSDGFKILSFKSGSEVLLIEHCSRIVLSELQEVERRNTYFLEIEEISTFWNARF